MIDILAQIGICIYGIYPEIDPSTFARGFPILDKLGRKICDIESSVQSYLISWLL